MQLIECPNQSTDWKCPICGTNEQKPAVLIPIGDIGKGDKELNLRARCYHLDCINLIDFDSAELQMGPGARVMTFIYKDKEDIQHAKTTEELSKIYIP